MIALIIYKMPIFMWALTIDTITTEIRHIMMLEKD